MQRIDVNVLVYAHREDAPHHVEIHRWLLDLLESGSEWITTDRDLLSG